ncbi:hypothetical protein M422DRAFT_187149 [Sphaerobolus stellatus SS14]|uniref:Major facilitator superfamily (MFS) profile domain-containing protein n=1 Tax=Sphaerobolus stellatus (strain SS14) TaxID=990650 RepID=A0A0C9U7Z4_SPHS4|nr:hypothetical protein M422DRAFT_187149 [Sphaerobolus stellatus SS14]
MAQPEYAASSTSEGGADKRKEEDGTASTDLAKDAQAESDDFWANAPANPLNWSTGRKWKNVAIVSLYTFVSPLASSMMAPGLPEIATHYGITSPTVVALTLSIFLLAFAIGPLFSAPLTEIYGRVWVLHLSNLFFLAFSIGCIFAPSTGSLIAFRFLAGLGGSTPVAIGGSCISDVFVGSERGSAMALYSMGPLLGPILGPIAGGFLVQTVGFKWVFILLSILAGVASVIAIPILEETYAPIVKERFAVTSAAADPDNEKGSPFIAPSKRPAFRDTILTDIQRPFTLLTRSLICFMLSFYMALIYGYLYLLFTTFPTLFPSIYGWGPGVSGLAYLGPGIGFFIGTLGSAPLMNSIYTKLTAKNNGVPKPEFRIPIMFLGSALVPIGLFWYGWSAQAKIHWIMPIFGAGIFCAGMMLVFVPVQLYLVDSFTYAASALAAAAVSRSLLGFAFPLFGEVMFAALGEGGGNSLLAGVAILTGVPFPIWLFYKGEEMRMRNPLNR